MKTFLQKILIIFVGLFLVFGLTSCEQQNNPHNQHSNQQNSKSQGIVNATQERIHAILDDAEVQKTLQRIKKSDEFYNKDGAIFMNREKLLPIKTDKEYYSEWTVKTPGTKTRGLKRVVVGKGGEMYFTDDHYKTFIQIK